MTSQSQEVLQAVLPRIRKRQEARPLELLDDALAGVLKGLDISRASFGISLAALRRKNDPLAKEWDALEGKDAAPEADVPGLARVLGDDEAPAVEAAPSPLDVLRECASWITQLPSEADRKKVLAALGVMAGAEA